MELMQLSTRSFGLGASGKWVKLGKGVLGRTMPFAITIVVFEAIVSTLLAFVTPDDLFFFSMAALVGDCSIFMAAIFWAHCHPVEAASEGKELADIRHAEAYATKYSGERRLSANVTDPLNLGNSVEHRLIGTISAEVHGTMPELSILPRPNISRKRKEN